MFPGYSRQYASSISFHFFLLGCKSCLFPPLPILLSFVCSFLIKLVLSLKKFGTIVFILPLFSKFLMKFLSTLMFSGATTNLWGTTNVNNGHRKTKDKLYRYKSKYKKGWCTADTDSKV